MKKNQRGFSVIESIMVVVIVILLGAVGYLFWDKIASKSTESKTTTVTQSVSPSPSPTVSTKTYTSTGVGVAFDYPSTWTVATNSKSNQYEKAKSGSEYMTVKAPSGFTMLFNAVAPDGLGGTGPCDDTITNFVYEGDAQVNNAHVISFNDNGTFILRLDKGKTADNLHPVSCPGMDYSTLINIKDAVLTSDNMSYVSPYDITFGTTIFGEDAVSKVKPSDAEYKQAVSILKSVRKV